MTLPESITSIGELAFDGCSGLTSIIIPESVISIGNGAFENCSRLNSVTINSNYIVSQNYTTSKTLKSLFNSQVKEYIIGNSVTSIGDHAFFRCSGLKSVTLPNGVTSIGNLAFYDCSGLTSVTIPNSVTSIGNRAFSGCSGLTSLTIPNSVTSIGNDAFYGCTGLTSLTIPNSVSFIGENAFTNLSLNSIKVDKDNNYYDSRNNCNAIIETSSNTMIAGCKNTIIPNNVTKIGNWVFSGCSDLTSITIPNSVKIIGVGAFYGCSSLTSVTIPNSVTIIDGLAFDGCTNLASVVIGNSVTSIDASAFRDCQKLTTITIPNSVFSIGANAFYGCTDLSSVNIGNCVNEIGLEAFANCKNLQSVVIPNSVTSIGEATFYGCSGLTSVTIGSGVTQIGYRAFDNCYSLSTVTNLAEKPQDINLWGADMTLHIRKGFRDVYKNTNWRLFTIIDDIEESTIVDTKALLISNDEGYATFYDSEYSYALPTGVRANVVSDVNNNKLVYTTIADGSKSNNVIPKGVAVVIDARNSSSKTLLFTKLKNSNFKYTGINYLYGSDGLSQTTGYNCYFYKLTYDNSNTKFGWYWGAVYGGPFLIETGHKAWLALPKSMDYFSMKDFISIEEDETSVDGVRESYGQPRNGMAHDIIGRQFSASSVPGLYIINGKKVLK